ADDGTVLDEQRAAHPDGTEVDPGHWVAALEATTGDLLPRAAAVSVAGQQHGMVALGADGRPVRPALLWNDLRSAPQAAELVTELGGPSECAALVGSVLVASYTVTKLRWLRDHEPDHADAVRRVLLPHDLLTWHLAGRHDDPVTDRGDASGTGYFSTVEGRWLPDVAARALGHEVGLSRVAAPAEAVGRTATGAVIGCGTGDNMAAALGLGLEAGDVAVSVGTSGVASVVSPTPTADPSGLVSGFADATGRFLPLVCTLNASRVLDLTARLLGVDHTGLASLALASPPGAGGLTLLPYLDGERTPNRPDASGTLHGLTSTTSREQLARAAVEGLLCSLADAVDHLVAATGTPVRRVVLVGGGARNEAVRVVAPAVLGVPVHVPPESEYVARGAARQAAWVLSGDSRPPAWPLPDVREYEATPTPQVRARYAALREDPPPPVTDR
ncbi:MAG TPA: FGGY-family carbohydrate kinase, partial [Actinomycetales bacterium]|nr:FGGY-family carbohydrate kinase [Actinomycetales bacterium]